MLRLFSRGALPELLSEFSPFLLTWRKSRKSYCTTPGVGVGVSKKFDVKVFNVMGKAHQVSYPVPVTGLVKIWLNFLVCQKLKAYMLNCSCSPILTAVKVIIQLCSCSVMQYEFISKYSLENIFCLSHRQL